jgi:SAM-dependent methyltransferase
VAELTRVTGLTQSRVSTHLAKLKGAGLVKLRRNGTLAHYAATETATDREEARLWAQLRGRMTDPLLEEDLKRARAEIAGRQQPTWADSVAGQMERHYSPGRTWETTARAFLGLVDFGEVVDLASGDGALAELLAPRATAVTCVDVSPSVISAGEERLAHLANVRFVRGDMHDLPLEPGAYDQAFLMNALTYARDPSQVLSPRAQALIPRGRRRHHRDQHLQRPTRSAQADYPSSRSPRLSRLNLRGRELNLESTRVAGRRLKRIPNSPASSPGCSGPPTGRLPFPRRQRPRLPRNVTFDQLVEAYDEQTAACSTAAPTCCWSRPSSTPSTPRPPSTPSRKCLRANAARVPVMISGTITDARPHLRPDHRGLLELGPPRQPSASGLNCALGAEEMRPYMEELSRIADTDAPLLPQRGPAQRLRRLRRDAGDDGRPSREFADAASSTWWAAAAAPRPITSAPSPRRCAGCPPRRPAPGPLLRLSGLEPLDHRPRHSLFVNVGERTNVTGSAKFAQADQGRRLRRGPRPSPASRWRTAPRSSTSTWTRACSTPSRPW